MPINRTATDEEIEALKRGYETALSAAHVERDQARAEREAAVNELKKRGDQMLEIIGREARHGESIPETTARLLRERDAAGVTNFTLATQVTHWRSLSEQLRREVDLAEANVRGQNDVIARLRAERDDARRVGAAVATERDEWRTRALDLGEKFKYAMFPPEPEYVTRAEFDALTEQVARIVRGLIRTT